MSVIEHHGCFIILWVCVDFLLDFFSNKYGGGLAMGRKEKKKGYLQNSAQQVAVERLRSIGANRDWTLEGKGFPVCKRWKEKKHMRALSPQHHQSEIYTKREQVSDVRVSLRWWCESCPPTFTALNKSSFWTLANSDSSWFCCWENS